MEKDKNKAPEILQSMRNWEHDTDFNGLRGAEALAKLPADERADWQRLWDDVATLRRRAELKEKAK